MIDTHVHFWKYDPVRDAWIDESMPEIRRDFLPEDLRPLLRKNAVEGIVAVQADQSENETFFLADLAKQHSFIKGVVGWIDLQTSGLEERLEKFAELKVIKGWRHIVQAEPQGFLAQDQFRKNVEILGKRNYTYGILIYHTQFPEALEFVKSLPEQRLVLNHIGKPDLKQKDHSEWRANIQKLAEFPHVHCKLSGLVTEAAKGAWTKEMLFDTLDPVVEHFGTKRVMFGTDWPVLLLNSHYQEWLDLFKEYITRFTAKEQRQMLHQNAVDFYQLSL